MTNARNSNSARNTYATKQFPFFHLSDRLNLFGVAAAALLLSYSFSFAPPAVIVKNTSAMLGNPTVGASAAVEPNEYNTLAQALADKEASLNDRERTILELNADQARTASFAAYSFIVGVLLCALVAANLYFDWRRERKRMPTLAVDLRR